MLVTWAVHLPIVIIIIIIIALFQEGSHLAYIHTYMACICINIYTQRHI